MGSSNEDEPEVEPARTRAEWATRLYRTMLRPMDRNLQALNQSSNPQVELYLITGNETTIRILTNRMRDLRACSERLARVGPPPAANLGPIYESIERSCPHYDRVASLVLEAIPLYGSGKVAEARRLRRQAARPSRRAAAAYGRALTLVNQQMLLQDVR